LIIARITIGAISGLFRETVDTLTQERNLTILLHKRESHIQVPPDPKQEIQSGDEIVVLASRDKLRELGLRNQGVRGL
jgi:Trk K+ transport system NAD-binding subunit